jgi:phosphate transport system substrate-binding protein
MRYTVEKVVLGLGLLALTGCGSGENNASPGKPGQSGKTTATSSGPVKLSGSGSTFVKPLMDKWIAEYTKEKGGEINYQGQGSGAGVKQMTEQAVDFGCTDAFMKREQLAAAEKMNGAVVHIPITMGAIAVAYNLPGMDKPLNFSGEVLAEVFLGKIKKWNDEKLKKINAGVSLPDRDIAVVHRSDSSGSTSIFTEFLSKVSPEWKQDAGTGTTIKWPAGTGEPQTAGVAGAITKNPGSIGYIELFYAVQNKLQYGAVQNREGKFVLASSTGVSKAAEASQQDIPEDMRFSLTNPPGAESYPVGGTTWAVVYTNQKGGTGRQLADFLSWATHQGQKHAAAMEYAPLPDGLVKRIDEKLKLIK